MAPLGVESNLDKNANANNLILGPQSRISKEMLYNSLVSGPHFNNLEWSVICIKVDNPGKGVQTPQNMNKYI